MRSIRSDRFTSSWSPQLRTRNGLIPYLLPPRTRSRCRLPKRHLRHRWQHLVLRRLCAANQLEPSAQSRQLPLFFSVNDIDEEPEAAVQERHHDENQHKQHREHSHDESVIGAGVTNLKRCRLCAPEARHQRQDGNGASMTHHVPANIEEFIIRGRTVEDRRDVRVGPHWVV